MSAKLPTGLTLTEYNTARDMAQLSAMSYDGIDNLVAEAGMLLFGGIKEIRQQEFNTSTYSLMSSEGNPTDTFGVQGLDYTIYQHNDTNDLVVAFGGTELLSVSDWLSNLGQTVGLSEQHAQAVSLARSMQTMLDHMNTQQGLTGDDAIELSFTGHGLGGSLATAAALASDNEAFVFNATGLSRQTMRQYELDPANASGIHNFNVQGDFVTDHNEQMDNTTLGSGFAGFMPTQQQYGDVFWLESINDQADFGGWLLSDDSWAAEQAEAALNHTWHVAAWQMDQMNFI